MQAQNSIATLRRMPAWRLWVNGTRLGPVIFLTVLLPSLANHVPDWLYVLIFTGAVIGLVVGGAMTLTGLLTIRNARAALPGAPWHEVFKALQRDLFRVGPGQRK